MRARQYRRGRPFSDGPVPLLPPSLMRVSLFALALAALVTVPSVSAQDTGYPIARGNVSIGGTANISSTGYEDSDRLTEVTISPSVGYFITDGLMIGANLSFTSLSNGDDTQSLFGIGPGLTYFFGQPGASVYPHVGAAVAFETGSGDYSAFGGEVFAGALFMVARNVGITGQAFGQFVSADVGGGSVTGNSFGVRGGVTAFIGR